MPKIEKKDSEKNAKEFSIGSNSWEILSTIVPYIILISLYFCQQTITLSFYTKQYPKNQMDILKAIGMVNIYLNASVASISNGLQSGIGGLSSNAYGKKNYYLMGLYVHRGRIITLSFLIVAGFINFFFGISILSIFIQEKEVYKLVNIYIRTQVFALLFDGMNRININYLAILSKSHVNLIICCVNFALHFLWCYLLIYRFDLGILGAGLSLLITQLMNFFVSTLYIHFANICPESYFFINSDCFIGLWDYFKYSFPSIISIFLRFLSPEIQGVIAFSCSKLDFAAHVLVTSVDAILNSLSIGYHQGCLILMGKLITHSKVEIVEKYTKLLFLISNSLNFVVIIFISIFASETILFIVGNQSSAQLINLSIKTLYIILVCNFLFNNVGVYTGIIRALGRQLFLTIILLIGFFPVQICSSIVLAKVLKLGVIGLWTSNALGCLFILINYMIYYCSLNLKHLKIEIEERIYHDNLMIENNKITK